MEIKTKRLIIRSWEEKDAKELSQVANNPNISKNMVDSFPYPYTLKLAKAWLKTNVGMKRQTHFAITIDNKIAGGIGFSIDEDNKYSAGGGYWLGKAYWGKGIATEAWVAVTDYAFKKFRLKRMYAHVYTWNPASARVLEKAGYQLEGTLRNNAVKSGKVVDEWLYAKVK